jgi:uncharacterized phage-associated protein
MYDVLKIAKKIIHRANSDNDYGDVITNLKLQKLLYYLQGYHLAMFNRPIFKDDIEAWMYGPVVPCVYDEFNSFGSSAIILGSDEKIIELKKDEEELFNEVYDIYSQFSAIKLMKMTHNETPWKNTTVGKGNIISKKDMEKYFKTQLS